MAVTRMSLPSGRDCSELMKSNESLAFVVP